MLLEEFVENLLKDYPAVGYSQINNLCYIGRFLCNDEVSVEDIIETFVQHMQKYYGTST